MKKHMTQEEKIAYRKSKTALLVYSIVCNIPVCFFLCLFSSISACSSFSDGTLHIAFKLLSFRDFAINFGVSFVLAMCIANFIPLTRIGRWFTALFGVKNDTYTGNMQYRLLATLITSFIFFIIISPLLTILNCFILYQKGWETALLSFLINMPLMLLVGFVSSLISDITAYKAAHHIDETF